VVFLIDGFNLYHSILGIKYHHKGLLVKWLDICSLCNSLLHNIDTTATLEKVYYFSAYAYHLNDPGVIQRHSDYIKCLESTGIEPILGRFKPKTVNCTLCRRDFIKHEEKETDVAIAAKLLEVLEKKECETVVLVTGDTDIVPAVKIANSLFSNSLILCAFPFGRKNRELQQLAPRSFKIRLKSYVNNPFPNPVVLVDGTEIYKPASW